MSFFFRAFYFRAAPFFSFLRKSNCRGKTAKKVWFCQTKTSQMLVFYWYLVRERKQNQNMSFKNSAIFFRALLVARITLIRAGYIFAQEHCVKIKLTRKFHELRYFNQRFLNYKQKFSSDSGYIFFAHSVMQKLNFSSRINIAMKKVKVNQLTAGMLRKISRSRLNHSLQTMSEAFSFMNTVKGTPAYWKSIEILAKTKLKRRKKLDVTTQ